MAQKLNAAGIEQEAAAAALDRFEELGLVDDEEFARAWVESRLRARNSSRRAVAAELRAKGIADDIADEALASVDEQTELDGARRVARKFVRTLQNRDGLSPADQQRLYGRLSRRGFAHDVVRQVLQECLSDA